MFLNKYANKISLTSLILFFSAFSAFACFGPNSNSVSPAPEIGGAASSPEAVIQKVQNNIYSVKNILMNQGEVIKVTGTTLFVGDLHGDKYSAGFVFSQAFKFLTQGEVQNVIFLGDYVDKGEHSLETLNILMHLKMKFPDRVFLLRGNHEDGSLNGMQYSKCFWSECYRRAFPELWGSYNDLFQFLPTVAIVEDSPGSVTMCMHGGIPPKSQWDDLEELISTAGAPMPLSLLVERNLNLWINLTWSDPGYYYQETNSKRCGYGCVFDKALLNSFTARFKINRIVRGHQLAGPRGCKDEFGDSTCLTVFSSRHHMNQTEGAAMLMVNNGRLMILPISS